MGALILIIAFVIEIAFAAYCLITKSNQKRVQGYIRIGAFTVFVLLALVSIIQWSFRWFLLAALLLIWAVLGVWTLVRKPVVKKVYKSWHSVVRAIATLLLVFITLTPALIFPQHKMPSVTGAYKVATAKYTYTDENRIDTYSKTGEYKEVNVEFWYPIDVSGTYPLVVFSHGVFGIKASNTSTFMDLASNGYVVCSIDFPHQSLFTSDASGHMTTVDPSFIQEVSDVNNGKYDEAEIFKIEQKWMNLRTTDINFVLDTIFARAKDPSSGEVYQLIDTQRIGLMGHSLGGAASAQVARERNDIDAVVNLDADLIGEYLDYSNGKYVLNDHPYPVPILTIYADDLVRLMSNIKDPNDVIAVKHVSATAPEAYEVHLTGTNHMSLTDLSLNSPFFVSIINASIPKAGGHEVDPLSTIEKMNSIILQFFDATLKGEGSFTAAGTY